MVSLSLVPVIIAFVIITFVSFGSYLFFDRAGTADENKRFDLMTYSDMYQKGFTEKTNLLYKYVSTSKTDFYKSYVQAASSNGDYIKAKNMLNAIGLEDDEKEIIKQIETAEDKYIVPTEQKILAKMIQSSDATGSKKLLAKSEYTSCVNYVTMSQGSLSAVIDLRMQENISSITTGKVISLIIANLSLAVLLILSFASMVRIRKIGYVVEKMTDEDKSEVIKRREHRNPRLNKRKRED